MALGLRAVLALDAGDDAAILGMLDGYYAGGDGLDAEGARQIIADARRMLATIDLALRGDVERARRLRAGVKAASVLDARVKGGDVTARRRAVLAIVERLRAEGLDAGWAPREHAIVRLDREGRPLAPLAPLDRLGAELVQIDARVIGRRAVLEAAIPAVLRARTGPLAAARLTVALDMLGDAERGHRAAAQAFRAAARGL